MIQFNDIPIQTIKDIAVLAFGHKEWITSDINVRYQPYIKEYFEDADEYFEATFDGYFAGNTTAKYKVRIYPNYDIAVWYTYKEEKNKLLHCSNQKQCQQILADLPQYIDKTQTKRIFEQKQYSDGGPMDRGTSLGFIIANDMEEAKKILNINHGFIQLHEISLSDFLDRKEEAKANYKMYDIDLIDVGVKPSI